MSENTRPIPAVQSLMLHILQMLEDGKELSHKELVAKLVQKWELTDEQRLRHYAKSGVNIFDNRVSFAEAHFLKANLITRPRRAYLQITETGQALLEEKPDRISFRFLRERYESYARWWKAATTGNEDNGNESELGLDASDVITKSPEELFGYAESTQHNDLKEKLLEGLKDVSPTGFELLVVDLLEKMGYGIGRVTKRSRDGGIDGFIDGDELGLDVVGIQAKKYAENNTVSSNQIQEFAGALRGKAKKGIFITTSSFSPEAKKAAQGIDPKIALIDSQELVELMVKHNFGVKVKCVYEVKEVDGDFLRDRYGIAE